MRTNRRVHTTTPVIWYRELYQGHVYGTTTLINGRVTDLTLYKIL